jgi:ADP-ribosyl-[dinitrogen reductase] hydrolase
MDSSEISSSGFVVHSMQAALWAFIRAECFEEGAKLAVNLGDDSEPNPYLDSSPK